jgi:hypothetical protein
MFDFTLPVFITVCGTTRMVHLKVHFHTYGVKRANKAHVIVFHRDHAIFHTKISLAQNAFDSLLITGTVFFRYTYLRRVFDELFVSPKQLHANTVIPRLTSDHANEFFG